VAGGQLGAGGNEIWVTVEAVGFSWAVFGFCMFGIWCLGLWSWLEICGDWFLSIDFRGFDVLAQLSPLIALRINLIGRVFLEAGDFSKD
jgi:hypothetical protein